MNEILFQGKRTFNGEFIEGDLIHGVNSKKGNIYILPIVSNLAKIPCCDPIDGCEVIPETVGIYIGISDKRGAKLFVGSIFSYTEHAGYNMSSFTAEVVFDKECASFGYRKLGSTTYGVKHEMIHHFCEHDELSVDFLPYVEVIGNIHDKPLQP